LCGKEERTTSWKCKQNKGKGILVEKTGKLYFYEAEEEGGRSYLKYGRGDLLLFLFFKTVIKV
jgi:hypothetical protein